MAHAPSSAVIRASRSSRHASPRPMKPLSSPVPSPTDSPRTHFVPGSPRYALPIDATQFDRATRLHVTSFARPHMRIFYLAWLSSITGFLGWYAIPRP
ncbi:hypothetical protein PsorP6_014778 [Peronosclerospora sorghi]|uniref:Uncharacterized protein n=1 Tax=Peronosclerospora sorghi TaxID=230839 RepID=A0ACC0VUE8_9STRA|nr:hypothetical protein PsorP6_014778 [Peronosclerospora sorghi]